MQMHIISLKIVFAFIWLFFTVFVLFFNVTLPSVPLSHPPLPLSHSGIQLNHHRADWNSLLSSPEETHHVLWDCRLPNQPQGDGYRSVSATAHKTNKYSTVTALHSNKPKAIHPDPSNLCKICFGFSVVVDWQGLFNEQYLYNYFYLKKMLFFFIHHSIYQSILKKENHQKY